MIVTQEPSKIVLDENQHTVGGIKNIQYFSYPSVVTETDIFSELPDKVFSDNNEMGKTMNLFRTMFYDRINDFTGVVVLPKLMYSEEDEEQLVRLALPWCGGNAIIYFSFDKNNNQNFAGYSINNKISNEFSSNTKDINDSNRTEIVTQIIDLICKLS